MLAVDRRREIHSSALNTEQWTLEVPSLFEVSLARMQQDILDIVRGTYSNAPGYINTLNDTRRGVYRMLKFLSI